MNLTWHSTLGVSWPFKKHLQKYFLHKIRWVEKQIKFRKSEIWHILKIHSFSVFSNYSNLDIFTYLKNSYFICLRFNMCARNNIFSHFCFSTYLSLSKKWFHRFFFNKKLHTDLKKIILPKKYALLYARSRYFFNLPSMYLFHTLCHTNCE